MRRVSEARFPAALLLCFLLMAAVITACGKDTTGKKKEETAPAEKGPGSYSVREYSVDGDDNRTLVYTIEIITDAEGREVWCHSWELDDGIECESTDRYEYDEFGRTKSAEWDNRYSRETEYRRNESGRTIHEYDEAGRVTRSTSYDSAGNVTKTETTTYNGKGKLLTRTSKNTVGEVISFRENVYDSFGNATHVIEQEEGTAPVILAEYSPEERKITRYESRVLFPEVSESGEEVLRIKTAEEYYDAAGRMIREQLYNWEGGVEVARDSIEFEYVGNEILCSKRTRYDYAGTKLSVTEFDSEGRMTRTLYYDEFGTDITEIRYDWDAVDDCIPNRKILKMEEYDWETSAEGQCVKTTYYTVETTQDESYAGEDSLYYQHYSCVSDVYDDTLKSTWELLYCQHGRLRLDMYRRIDYTDKSGPDASMETEFDAEGKKVRQMSKSYWSGDLLRITETEFDDHENVVKEKITMGEGVFRNEEWEYTYYDENSADE